MCFPFWRDGKPVAPRRIGMVTRPAAAALVAVKPGVRIAGMVKHTVKNQTHPFSLRVVAQTQQRAVATELRIDAAIIFGIVFMHAGGDEYRVQIERGYAKLLEIRQFLADPIEVAAKKRRPARFAG